MNDKGGADSLSLTAAQALGKNSRSWIRLDGLTSLTPELAKALAPGGALSLKGLKRLDQETAKELAQHGCQLVLSGVEEVSDGAIEALAETKADLFLSSVATISDSALEKLVRFKGQTLVLGLRELRDNQARLMELFHGRSLALNSLTELSDNAAASLSRLSVDYLGLGGVQFFSEFAAARLAAVQGNLTLSGKLRISEKALLALKSDTRFESWLGLSGQIDLPDYAYELLLTRAIINGKWASSTEPRDLFESGRYQLPGRVITEKGAAELRYASHLEFELQDLPEAAASALSAQAGFLKVSTEIKPSLKALESLAERKYKKGARGWGLQVSLKDLNKDEAACLARTAYPLYLPQLRSLPDEAAVELAKHEGHLYFSDCVWPNSKMAKGRCSTGMVAGQWIKDGAVLSKVAIKALSKKKGSIDGQDPPKWAKEWQKVYTQDKAKVVQSP